MDMFSCFHCDISGISSVSVIDSEQLLIKFQSFQTYIYLHECPVNYSESMENVRQIPIFLVHC